MNSTLKEYIEKLEWDFDSISIERKMELDDLSNKMILHLATEDKLEIIVVCTHNSRRSQLGELWINTLAKHLGLDSIIAYSGGTEGTAFNIRMVNAIRKVGFELLEMEAGDNPKYVSKDAGMHDHFMFSKVYDDAMNPQEGYMALMVCGHADENCPIVSGMRYRIPLRYKDPKEFDDTPNEEEAYLDKVREIGTEIYYVLRQVKLLS